jgi:hypothetical protein
MGFYLNLFRVKVEKAFWKNYVVMERAIVNPRGKYAYKSDSAFRTAYVERLYFSAVRVNSADDGRVSTMQVRVLALRTNARRLKDIGFVPVAEGDVSSEQVARLVVQSGLVSCGVKGRLTDFSGVKWLLPVDEKIEFITPEMAAAPSEDDEGDEVKPKKFEKQSVDRKAINWDVLPVGDQGVVALKLSVMSFRNHLVQRMTGDEAVPTGFTLEQTSERYHVYFRTRDGFRAPKDVKWKYLAQASKRPMLVMGPSIRHGKEGLAWKYRNFLKISRSYLYHTMVESLATTMKGLLSFEPLVPGFVDRRFPVSFDGKKATKTYCTLMTREMWGWAKTRYAGATVKLVDIRLKDGGVATDLLQENVTAFLTWAGASLEVLPPLRGRLGDDFTVEEVRRVLAEIAEAHQDGDLWICVADRRAWHGFDAKREFYRLLPNVAKQSLCRGTAIFPSGKGAQLVFDAGKGKWKQATSHRSALLSLAIKDEIVREKVSPRHWLSAAAKYIFITGPFDLADPTAGQHYGVLTVDETGRIRTSTIEQQKLLGLLTEAKVAKTYLGLFVEKPNVTLEIRNAIKAAGGALIVDTDARIIPPSGINLFNSRKTGEDKADGRLDWDLMTSVLSIDEVEGWAVGPIERSTDMIAKGLVVRTLDGGRDRQAILQDIKMMCADGAVHIGALTVYPAPFRYLREAIEMEIGDDLPEAGEDDAAED